ncbi:MAG: DUF2384 domain-containing protein [Opitutales bacterium]|nr:DUF2384 domain-containing protein [Opitutales bacterium]
MNKKPSPQKNPAVEEPTAIYGVDRNHRRMGPKATVQKVRAGLGFHEFDALAKLLELPVEQLASHLSISRSTLARRRQAGRLAPLESDRLLRYARLWNRARETFGNDPAAARDWLHQPARALEFTSPLTFAETEAGAREVENLLGRIEHGVFS